MSMKEHAFHFENPEDPAKFVEGKICREWTEEEMAAGHTRTFGIHFDEDMDSAHKTLVLAAGFLINSNHYE